MLAQCRDRDVDVESEVFFSTSGDPARVGVARVLRVHGIGRGEGQRRASWAAEGLHEVQHDLVGAVRGPDLLGGDAHAGLLRQVVREVGPQRREVPVRVAVERRRRSRHVLRERRDDLRTGRVGVLVDVEQVRDVDLGRTVGHLAGEVGAQRQRDRGVGSWSHGTILGRITGLRRRCPQGTPHRSSPHRVVHRTARGRPCPQRRSRLSHARAEVLRLAA